MVVISQLLTIRPTTFTNQQTVVKHQTLSLESNKKKLILEEHPHHIRPKQASMMFQGGSHLQQHGHVVGIPNPHQGHNAINQQHAAAAGLMPNMATLKTEPIWQHHQMNVAAAAAAAASTPDHPSLAARFDAK